MISAIFSRKSDLLKLLRIDIKDKIQLAINKIVVAAVISSITVVSENFNIFKEVKTTKHSPNKLEDAFRIWGDF